MFIHMYVHRHTLLNMWIIKLKARVHIKQEEKRVVYQHYLTSTEQNRKNTANGNKIKRRHLSPQMMHESSCKRAFLVVFLIGLLLFNGARTIAMLFLRIQLFFQIIYNICKLCQSLSVDLNTLRS